MKYLNTNHLDLLASYGSNISVSGDFITTNATSSATGNTFAIKPPSTSKVYFSVNDKFNTTIASQYYAIGIGINFTDTSTWLGIHLDSTGLRLYRVTISGNNQAIYTQIATGNAPLDSNGNRFLHFRFDVTNGTVDIYCNGVLSIEAFSYGITSSSISLLRFGKIAQSANVSVGVRYYNNFIVSDSPFPPTERVIDVTPTITTTDWTVASGVATTNTVGDEMTLTVPSGAIDESEVKPTGYTVGLLDSAPSEDVNAVAITQGSTTDTVVLPSGSTQSAYFTVSQASAISASVVARSVIV